MEVNGGGQWSEGVADERQHCQQRTTVQIKSVSINFFLK